MCDTPDREATATDRLIMSAEAGREVVGPPRTRDELLSPEGQRLSRILLDAALAQLKVETGVEALIRVHAADAGKFVLDHYDLRDMARDRMPNGKRYTVLIVEGDLER
jgi:hypothetical protein